MRNIGDFTDDHNAGFEKWYPTDEQQEPPPAEPPPIDEPSVSDQAKAAEDPKPANKNHFSLDLITSADFDAGDFELQWLVEDVLVRDQPCILGGPKKALKTLLGIDLAVSVASGTPFLGKYPIPSPERVVVLSGESGRATLQAAARAIADARGRRLSTLDIHWGFNLPQLANQNHLAGLKNDIARQEAKLLLFDPLYLALLAGPVAQGISAANVYQMGPLLLNVAQACLSVGCTPVLFHHFRLSRPNAYAEPMLEDLAFAGVQEFARQWVLLSRRSEFDTEDQQGKHELWLKAGGSAGHSLLRAVDIYEGKIDRHFRGRTWRVEVLPPTDARIAESDAKAAEKDRKKVAHNKQDENKILQTLDEHDKDRHGRSAKYLRHATGLSSDRTGAACLRLVQSGLLEQFAGRAAGGNGAMQNATLYRRPGAA
jgi:hypothetical protein